MLQQQTETGLERALPMWLTTLTNYKGRWVYVRDIEMVKSTFEKLYPDFKLEFLEGPCLYFYKFCVVEKRTNKIKELGVSYMNERFGNVMQTMSRNDRAN